MERNQEMVSEIQLISPQRIYFDEIVANEAEEVINQSENIVERDNMVEQRQNSVRYRRSDTAQMRQAAQSELESLIKEKNKIETKSNSMEEELKETSKGYNFVQNYIKSLKSCNNTLEEELQKTCVQQKQTENEWMTTNEIVEVAKSFLNMFEERIETAVKEKNRFELQVSSSFLEIKKLKKEMTNKIKECGQTISAVNSSFVNVLYNNQEIQELPQLILESNNSLNIYNNQLNNKTNKIKDLENLYLSKVDELKQLSKETETIRKNLTETETEIQEIRNNNIFQEKQLQEELEKITTSNENSKHRHSSLVDKHVIVQNALEADWKKKDELEIYHNSLKSELCTLKEDVIKKHNVVIEIQRTCHKASHLAQTEHQYVIDEITKIERETAIILEESVTTETHCKELIKKQEQIQEDIMKLTNSIDMLTSNCTEIERKTLQYRQNHESVNNELNKIIAKDHELYVQLSESKNQLLKQKQSCLEELSQMNLQKQKATENYNNKISTLHERSNMYKSELQEFQKQQTFKNKMEINELILKQQQLKNEISSISSQEISLTDQINKQINKRDSLIAKNSQPRQKQDYIKENQRSKSDHLGDNVGNTITKEDILEVKSTGILKIPTMQKTPKKVSFSKTIDIDSISDISNDSVSSKHFQEQLPGLQRKTSSELFDELLRNSPPQRLKDN